MTELFGRATGNKRLAAEGNAEQATVKVKAAAQKARDAIKDVFD